MRIISFFAGEKEGYIISAENCNNLQHIPIKMPINTIINPQLDFFGWKTSAQEKRGSFKLTIHKNIAVGIGLSKGYPLYCYTAKDPEERPIIVVYLDGKPRGILWTKVR